MEGDWTAVRQVEAIQTTSGDSSLVVKKDRRFYDIRENFELVEIAGVQKVRRKRDQGITATAENFVNTQYIN